MPTQSKRQAENEARVAEAEAAHRERRAVRKISHREDGGARSVQDLRNMCEDLGISTGGYRDDLIKRIRTFQKAKGVEEAKAREKALAKARKKAEEDLEKGSIMMKEKDWVGAAKAFEFAAKILDDYPESVAYKTTHRCLKALRGELKELETEAATKLEDFLIQEKFEIQRAGKTAEETRAGRRMLSAIERDLGPEPGGKEVGATGRCRICTLHNRCPDHTTTEQRAHKVVTILTLVDPDNEKAKKQKLVAAYIEEEQRRARKFEELADADAKAKREKTKREEIEASERKRKEHKQKEDKDRAKWKKELEAKTERRAIVERRQEAIEAEKRYEALHRHESTRTLRTKHVLKTKQKRMAKKAVENWRMARANAELPSRAIQARSLIKYDRMIKDDCIKKQEEAEKRKLELEAQVAFGIRKNEKEMAAQAEALTSSSKDDDGASGRALTYEGNLLLQSEPSAATKAARRAADAAIWGLVEEALTAPLPQVECKMVLDDHRRSAPMLEDRRGVRVSLSLPDVPTREPPSRDEALAIVLRGTVAGTTHNARKMVERNAEDSRIWEHAKAALQGPLQAGVSLSLPRVPSPKPIDAGEVGSEWGVGWRAPIRVKKHAAERHLANLELDRLLGEQDAEDARWHKMEEQGTVKVDIARARNLRAMATGANPYATCTCNYEFGYTKPGETTKTTCKSVKTFIKSMTKNPRWDETFELHNVHNLAAFTITIWDRNRTNRDKPMGEIKLKVREMRGNMWQKQNEGGEDVVATDAAKDEMEKRQKLLQARKLLAPLQAPDDRELVAADGGKPILMLGNKETERDVETIQEHEEQDDDADAGLDSRALPTAQVSPSRVRKDEWHTLQPVPPSLHNPSGCPNPQGQISMTCIATFEKRGTNYATLEMRRRSEEVRKMTAAEQNTMLGDCFHEWKRSWRPTPPPTPELERRRRRLDENRQALEDEFGQFVDLTIQRAEMPLGVASSNNHLSEHIEVLRRRQEESRVKEEQAEERAAEHARERRLQLTGGLFGS